LKKPFEPKYRVKIKKNVKIPMRDGINLAADLLMPEVKGKYPAVMLYLPYRKDDILSGESDALQYLARRGYVGVRLDVRGTGSSEGHTIHEYSSEEQRDSYDAIQWLGDQDWCNGNVGMYGLSYGGQVSMTAAFLNPPNLKAIIPMGFSDDRYLADCHYVGGSLRVPQDYEFYGIWMVAMNAMPLYPELIGEKWAEMWKTRLEKSEPWLLPWLEHQVHGPFWKSGSVKYRYEKVRSPVYMMAGWQDGYPDSAIRIYQNLKTPKKLLIGPWMHIRPDRGIPGPKIHYFHEMQRWFDYWLKGIESDIMEEPPVCVYVQKYDYPVASRDITSGYWKYEKSWPITRTRETSLYFHPEGNLSYEPCEGEKGEGDSYEYLPTVGTTLQWFASCLGPMVLSIDQRYDEAFSLNYTSPPLEEDMEVTGFPNAILYVSSTADIAGFAVKLNDVAEDGASANVSHGYLNATRRNSFTEPEPLTPGEVYELNIPLKSTSWLFEKGHRIRVSIQSGHWHNVWPTPKKSINSIYLNKIQRSKIILPTVTPSTDDLPEPRFLDPPPPAEPKLRQISPEYRIIRDHYNRTATVVAKNYYTQDLPELDAHNEMRLETLATASETHPEKASVKSKHALTIRQGDNFFEITSSDLLRSTAEHYHIIVNLDVKVNGGQFFQKEWTRTIKRVLA